MPKLDMEKTTIGEYDPASLDPTDDPETPLCVVSVDGEDTIFISPIKGKDYKFVVFVDGEESHYKDSDELLSDFELYDIDQVVASEFIDDCSNFLSQMEESTLTYPMAIAHYIHENKKVCYFENTEYKLLPNNILLINEKCCDVEPEQAKILYESVEMRTK